MLYNTHFPDCRAGADWSINNMLDINKAITDVFDFFADQYAVAEKKKVVKPIDVSEIPIGHLLSAEEKADPIKLYAVSDAVPDLRVEKTASLPFLDIWDGEFKSPVESPFHENNTVHVKHYKLKNKPGGGPTVMMINGWNVADNTYFDWWCWRFAAWGLSSILMDIPYHIRRVPRGSCSGQLLLNENTNWSVLSLKQSFQDIQAVINWLKSEGAGEIGTFGVSFGALMSGIYVCHATNADFAIMGMPPMDAVDVLKKISFGENLMAMEARGEQTMLSDPDIPNIFNMAGMTPNVDKNKIFIAMGIYDRLVPPETIREVSEKWGGLPWLKEYPTGHINTFVFNLPFINDVRKFLKAEIV